MLLINRYLGMYGAAIALCFSITMAVYPGFMSYDSLHALEQARTGITSADWPPFVSYVWYPLDLIWPGPTLMHLVQNGLLLCSTAYIISQVTDNVYVRAIVLMAFTAISPILGPMLVVWKDIPVASTFCCAGALMMAAQLAQRRRLRATALILAPLLIFAGMAYRFNASSAAVPLLWWWSRLVFTARTSWADRYARPAVLSLGTLAILFLGVLMLSWYRLPDLSRLKPNAIFDTVMLYDLVGITKYSNETVMHLDRDPDGKEFSRDDVASIYTPQHGLITLGKLPAFATRTYTPDKIKEDWRHAVQRYPGAYLRHRLAVFRELIGATSKPVFYPTHYGVDQNNLGITFVPSILTTNVLNYVLSSSKTLVGRPFLYYLIAFLSVLYSYAKNINTKHITLILYMSGILYLIPQFILNPASDSRYNFWAVVASLLTIILGTSGLPKDRWRQADFGELSAIRPKSGGQVADAVPSAQFH